MAGGHQDKMKAGFDVGALFLWLSSAVPPTKPSEQAQAASSKASDNTGRRAMAKKASS